MDFNSLYPMPHHKIKGSYRVPVQKLDSRYTVFTAQKSKRILTADTLPNFIKHKLTMAEAAADKEYPKDSDILWIDIFLYKGPSGMDSVAWKASETMYIVVMNDKQLNTLKGLPV